VIAHSIAYSLALPSQGFTWERSAANGRVLDQRCGLECNADTTQGSREDQLSMLGILGAEASGIHASRRPYSRSRIPSIFLGFCEFFYSSGFVPGVGYWLLVTVLSSVIALGRLFCPLGFHAIFPLPDRRGKQCASSQHHAQSHPKILFCSTPLMELRVV
jgi:hypothetical protein